MVNSITIVLLSGLAIISASQSKDNGIQLRQFLKTPTSYFLDFDIMEGQTGSTDDEKCLAEMAMVVEGLKAGNYWALKMIDSWGSLPSGLLYGTFYDLGNFDECLKVHEEISNSQTIQGKYCFLAVPLKDIIDTGIKALETMQVKIATCFPASCSATQMEKFVGQLYQNAFNSSDSSLNISIDEDGCQTSETEPWDWLTVFTVVILSLLTLIVALCTLYDYFLCTDQKQLPALVKIISARANSRALFRVVNDTSNPNVISCLNGIRCLSLIWVVYLHEHMYSLISPNINFVHAISWMEKPFASFFLHGYFSVDSFLFIGGLLVSMTALRSMEKTKGKLNVPMMYLHRIIRILPVLAMAILVYMKLMPVLSGGPLFKSGFHGKEACQNGWYWDLLFIQNYATEDCLDQSWYLAVDMQLYIISPLLLIALYKWGKKAAAGILVLIVLLSGCLFATQMVNHYSMMRKNGGGDPEANAKLYLATHTHAAPWLIGFLFGYFLHLNRGKKFELNRLVVWGGWFLSLAMIFTSIFALYPAGKWSAPALSTVEESLYYTLTRVGWPLALCWIVFACMQGYGSLANSLLSSPLWQPLSRLSYSIFIWHMFVQEVNSRNVRTSTYFSNYKVMLNFWSDFGISLVMSYLLYLIIEAPIGGLDALWRPRGNPKPIKTLAETPMNQTETRNPDKATPA
ncbi:nose resistant to fluoxetine protein 6-like [Drosophila serrata]|uniref:nose resistant to fluoxetine protein 6-like n=1 Tax=Drosophila serrata TaxID=7274 RepID=UPI000A1D0182|nr:nose resistant to fluoxetine protein 6-like [Drosophila serrata]